MECLLTRQRSDGGSSNTSLESPFSIDLLKLSSDLSKALRERKKNMVAEICEQCPSEEIAFELLRVAEKSLSENLETAILVFYYCAGKKWLSVNNEIKAVCKKLVNFPHSRLVRKTAIFTLKATIPDKDGLFWSNYFDVLNALEEPQFHLVEPVLPKIDVILREFLHYNNDNKDGCWDMIELLFTKALLHSNGWIRNWTLMKIISIDLSKFFFQSSFLLNGLFPLLSSNDVYWRLLENNLLNPFVEQFTAFLQNFVNHAPSKSCYLEHFFEATLNLLIERWSSSSLFFFSVCLTKINNFQIFNSRYFFLFKRVLYAVNNIQQHALKLCTACNLVAFFIRGTKWELNAVWAFTSVLFTIKQLENNNEVHGLHELAANAILENWKETDNNSKIGPVFIVLQFLKHLESDNSIDFHSSYADVVWITAKHYKMCVYVLELLVELLSTNETGSFNSTTEIVMLACLKAPRDCIGQLSYKSLDSFKRSLFVIWDSQLFGTHRVDFWKKYGKYFAFVSCMVGVVETWYNSIKEQLAKDDGDVQNRMHIIAVFNAMRSTCFDNLKYREIVDYLCERFHLNSSVVNNCKERVPESVKLSQAYFLLLCLDSVDSDVRLQQLLRDILDLFEKTSSWSEKNLLLISLRKILQKIGNKDLIHNAIDIAYTAVLEERNSRHYLKVIEGLLSVILQKELLLDKELEAHVMTIMSALTENAALHVELAYFVSDGLLNNWCLLGEEWIFLVIKLCTFGPLPSKNAKVLFAACSWCFKMPLFKQYFSSQLSVIDKLHNVVRYVRLKSFLTAAKMCTINAKFGYLFMEKIFEDFQKNDELKNKSFGLSVPHRQKTRLMQTLLLLMSYLDKSSLNIAYKWCLDKITDPAQQYSVKLLEEWTLILCLCTQPELFENFISREHSFANTRVGSITSWINVLMHVAKSGGDKEKISACFRLFLPWCTAQNFSIRCSAIAALRCLWQSSPTTLRSKFDYIKRIISFDAEPSGNAKRIIDTLCDDFYFAVFHPKKHYNLQVICDIFPRKTGLPAEETISPNIFEDVLPTDENPFILYETDDTLEASPSLVFSNLSKQANRQVLLNYTAQMYDENETKTRIQRKLDVIRGHWHRPEGKSFIVVATLVDKATNLGGLCRTCEVFGVEKLVIADLNILNDQNFKALSTSSEKWMDLEQVKPGELIDYLKARHDEGYTTIGAEQSTDSECFSKFKFPPKSLVLLGDEREGIPVELIRFVDITVEIPQFGQTRSLNVHVTGALFIQKYVETHYLSEN